MIVSVERPAEDWSDEDRSLASRLSPKKQPRRCDCGRTRWVMSPAFWTLPRICKEIFIYLRNSIRGLAGAREDHFYAVGGS